MNRQELEQFITETYSAEADYPWAKDPDSAVFRHGNNRRWFALIMNIPKARLGLRDAGMVSIVNFKCSPIIIGSLLSKPGFFPAYHMSKDSWISAVLDGSASDDDIKMLLDMSFASTAVKMKKRKTSTDA